jgi:hypothetical protein
MIKLEVEPPVELLTADDSKETLLEKALRDSEIMTAEGLIKRLKETFDSPYSSPFVEIRY